MYYYWEHLTPLLSPKDGLSGPQGLLSFENIWSPRIIKIDIDQHNWISKGYFWGKMYFTVILPIFVISTPDSS